MPASTIDAKADAINGTLYLYKCYASIYNANPLK